MVLNLNHPHLSLDCHMKNTNIFTFFSRYSNSFADLLRLVYLIIEACMKLKPTKISGDIAQ